MYMKANLIANYSYLICVYMDIGINVEVIISLKKKIIWFALYHLIGVV